MKVDITYPAPEKRSRFREKLIRCLKPPFLLAAYICPIINILSGGRAWSVVALWSMWIVWSSVISPALVEYNRTSQLIKLVADSCLLLILIGALLSPGWAARVVPIVSSSGILLAGGMFFADKERQRQNLFPLLLLAAASLVSAAAGLVLLKGEELLATAAMGAVALAFLAVCAAVLGPDFIRELRKRFHTR